MANDKKLWDRDFSPAKLLFNNSKDPDCTIGIYREDPGFSGLDDEEFVEKAVAFARNLGAPVNDIVAYAYDELTDIEKKDQARWRKRRLDKQAKIDEGLYHSNHVNCVTKGDDVNYKILKKGGKTCMAKKQRAKKGVDYYTVPETTKVTDHNGVVKDVPVTAHSSYTVSIRTSDENLKSHPTTKDGKARKKYYHLNAKSWAEAEELAASVGINGDRVTVTKHATTILATDVPVRKNSGTIHQWKEQDGSFGKGVNWDDGAGKTIEKNGGVPLGRVKVGKMQRNKRVYLRDKNAVDYDDPK